MVCTQCRTAVKTICHFCTQGCRQWTHEVNVYEEETDFVFEDMSERILQSSITQRLLSFPNVVMTSHQGFFTKEALTNIAETTLENAKAFMDGNELKNEVLS